MKKEFIASFILVCLIVLSGLYYFYIFIPNQYDARNATLTKCLATAKLDNEDLFKNFYKDPGYFGNTSTINKQVTEDWKIRNTICYETNK